MTKEDIDASEAPLLDHLIELRTRLIYCVAGFFLTFIVSFFYSSNILSLLILPFKWGTGPMWASFPSSCSACSW